MFSVSFPERCKCSNRLLQSLDEHERSVSALIANWWSCIAAWKLHESCLRLSLASTTLELAALRLHDRRTRHTVCGSAFCRVKCHLRYTGMSWMIPVPKAWGGIARCYSDGRTNVALFLTCLCDGSSHKVHASFPACAFPLRRPAWCVNFRQESNMTDWLASFSSWHGSTCKSSRGSWEDADFRKILCLACCHGTIHMEEQTEERM